MGNVIGCNAVEFMDAKCKSVVRSLEAQVNSWTEDNKEPIEALIKEINLLNVSYTSLTPETETEFSKPIIFDGDILVKIDQDFNITLQKRKKVLGIISRDSFGQGKKLQLNFKKLARLAVQNDLLFSLAMAFLRSVFISGRATDEAKRKEFLEYSTEKFDELLKDAANVRISRQDDVIKRTASIFLYLISSTNFTEAERKETEKSSITRNLIINTNFKGSFLQEKMKKINDDKSFKYRTILCGVYNIISMNCQGQGGEECLNYETNEITDEGAKPLAPVCLSCRDKMRRVFFSLNYGIFKKIKVKIVGNTSLKDSKGGVCGNEDNFYDFLNTQVFNGTEWNIELAPAAASKY